MDSAQRCVTVICGLPGSGKTGLCQSIANVKVEGCKVYHLSFDTIWREEQGLSNKEPEVFQPELWKEARQRAYDQLETVLGAEIAKERELVLVDDNMHLRSMRRKCYQIARKWGAAFVVAYLPCLPEDALRRNAAREGTGRVPDEVILRMAAALEPPDPDACTWDRNNITVNTNNAQIVLQEILDRWKGPVEPLPAAPEPSSPDLAHGLDIICRQTISRALAATEGAERSARAQDLNLARRALLSKSRAEGLTSDKQLQAYAAKFMSLCGK